MQGKSRIPRSVVHGSVLGPFEAQDFLILLVSVAIIFVLTGQTTLTLALLFGGLLALPKMEKFRYKYGPAFIQRKAWKLFGIKINKKFPDYLKVWYKA